MIDRFHHAPLPADMLPPPQGWVFIGGGFEENRHIELEVPSIMWNSTVRAWTPARNRQISNPRGAYAIPHDSPFLERPPDEARTEPVAPRVFNWDAFTDDVVSLIRRIADNFPFNGHDGYPPTPPPEGQIIVGRGTWPGEMGDGLARAFRYFGWPTSRQSGGYWFDDEGNRWRNDPSFGGVAFYSVPENHDLAHMIRAMIAETAESAQPVESTQAVEPTGRRWIEIIQPLMPDGLPPVPARWMYVGDAFRFYHLAKRHNAFNARFASPGMTRWGLVRDFANGNYSPHAIIEMDGALHLALTEPDNWRFPAGNEWPADCQAVPQDWMMVGRGGTFPLPGLFGIPGPIEEVKIAAPGGNWISMRSVQSEGMIDERVYYAIPESHPYAQALIELHNSNDPVESEAETDQEFRPRKWRVLMNGVPIASKQELVDMVRSIEIDSPDPRQFANRVWGAIHQDGDPNDIVIELIDTFPVASAVIDFEQTVSHNSGEVIRVASSDRPLPEIVATIAAGAMLRGGMHEHFIYNDSGLLVINGENPPTVEQGYEMIRRTMQMKQTAAGLDSLSGWNLGMLGSQLQDFFGDAFNVDEVLGQTRKAYNTFICAVNVFRNCWNWREEYPGLSFTHFKEVYLSTLSDDEKHFVLGESNRLHLSAFEQRKLKTYVRLYGTEALTEQPLEDVDDLDRRTETRAVNRRYLFFLRADNRWYEYKGPFEHIPNGASPILNADTRAIVGQNGSETPVRAWTRPGQELPRGNAMAREAEATAFDPEAEGVAAPPDNTTDH